MPPAILRLDSWRRFSVYCFFCIRLLFYKRQSVCAWFWTIEKAVHLSGRWTFITNAARKISTVGGSFRDVQVGHREMRAGERLSDAHLRLCCFDLVPCF